MKNRATLYTKPVNIIIFALICTLLWGSAFPCVKIGYKLFCIHETDIPSKLLFAGYRFLLAGILVSIFSIQTNKKVVVPAKKEISAIIVLGLIQTSMQYVFFYIGLTNTTGVKASVLNATGTFAAVILAHFCFHNDRLTLQKASGCLIGFAGVVLINLEGSGIDAGFHVSGEGLIVLSQISFAIGVIITKRITARADSVVVTGYQLVTGGFVLVVTGFVSGGKLGFESLDATLLLIYLALLSAVAFSLWTQLIKYNSVGKISVYNFLIPVFGSLLSAILLRESIFHLKGIGAVLLASLGIYIVNRKKDL